MSDEEITRLWDPRAPLAGAESVEAIELRLETLRGPREAPPLELPPRTTKLTRPISSDHSQPSGLQPWAVALLIAAAIILVFVVTRDWTPYDATSNSVALAPDPAPHPVDEQASPGWRVERFEGDAMCNAPGVERAIVEGTPLVEGMPLDAGPASTLRLRNGDAIMELHPNSRIRQREDAIELAFGRMWIDLPRKADASLWTLRTAGATLRTEQARFVWFAHEPNSDSPHGPWLASEAIGLRVESGKVELATGSEQVIIEAGQDCHLAASDVAHEALGPVECARH